MTLMKEQGRTHTRRSPMDPLHTDLQELDDQLELIYNCTVRTQETCLKRWMIETKGERERERESRKSMLAAWHDDDDEEFHNWIHIIRCSLVL